MKLDIKKVKIVVTVPADSLEEVRNAVCEAGAGVVGNYDHCSYSSKVVGTFRPNEKANPYIGENGKLEFVKEEKLEVVCDVDKVNGVIAALRKAHPYEEPAIEIITLLTEESFSINSNNL